MAFFAWDEQYSVGDAGIDRDHKRLFDLVNKLHEAMTQGKGKEVLGKTLGDLVNYTKDHFRREEAEMSRICYADAAAHRLEHEKLLREALNLQRQFNEGNSMLTIQVSAFLKNWLINHIHKSDKALGLAMKTVKAA